MISTSLSTTCYRGVLSYSGHISRRQPDNLDKLVVIGEIEGKSADHLLGGLTKSKQYSTFRVL
ncbi:hypothetical protein RR48_10822 [Papilio machaon]|uniref:Uncharacterized protein n=1 Tax=Papilio machaon TaxID=76193 RepID=A0A194R741_PAPMA|nr:hypothetical protein RR48_10822 [Papilio machaon]